MRSQFTNLTDFATLKDADISEDAASMSTDLPQTDGLTDGMRSDVQQTLSALATLVLASIAPLIPLGLIIYLLNVGWAAGLWYFGKKVERMRQRSPWEKAGQWAKRGWSLFRWR